MTKQKEGMLVNLDIHTVEDVTARYLMELYTELQSRISKFIKERVEGGTAPIGEWERFQKWHDDSESCRKILISILEYDDYSSFMEKTYKKFYPPNK